MLASLLLAITIAAAPEDSLRADQDVRASVLRNSGDVRHCYEREGLTRDPELLGTVEVTLRILPTGLVDHVAVDTTALRGAAGRTEIGACIATAAHNWRFERGPFGVQTVVFPFTLAPADRPPAPRVVPTRG